MFVLISFLLLTMVPSDQRFEMVHQRQQCLPINVSIAWEIPPFSGISDFVVSSGFPEEHQNGFNASIKDGKSTLIFVVSKKMNQSLVVRCRDGSVDDFPIISSITLIINSEFLLVNIK